MDQNKVDMFLMSSSKYFEQMTIPVVRDQLMNADENQFSSLMTTQFKDPTTILIISVLAGTLGIDRFMIGDTGLGIGKLLTCGGFGIWAIVDWFLIMPATKEKNMQKFRNAMTFSGPPRISDSDTV